VQLFHWTNISAAVLVPVAFILSPSFLNWPVDITLGVILPIHSHIGLETVILDYVPRSLQSLSIVGLWIVTGLTLLGLLKINLCGSGITESVKSLWRAPQKVVKQ